MKTDSKCHDPIINYKKSVWKTYLKDGDDLHAVKNLELEIMNAINYMSANVRHEDVAVFFGITKSGKSTLINYIIGNKLVGVRERKFLPVMVVKGDDADGPEIGSKSESQTIIPKRYSSTKLLNLGLWDTPGFGDNRGPIQDITNAVYINHIFKNVKSAKIVLVVAFNDIMDDSVNTFLSLLKAVENLLKNSMSNSFNGISVIFTKVPSYFVEVAVDKEFIKNVLNEKLLKDNLKIHISPDSKNFVDHLIKNDNSFGLFRRAEVGNVTDSISVGIIEAINAVKSLSEDVLKQISPSMSEDSQAFLYRTREELSSVTLFSKLLTLVQQVLSEQSQDIVKFESSNPTKNDIRNYSYSIVIQKDKLEQCLNENATFVMKIDCIKSIHKTVADLIENNNMTQKAKYLELIDQLLEMNESKFFEVQAYSLILSALQKKEEFLLRADVMLDRKDREELDEDREKLHASYKKKLQDLQDEMVRLAEREKEAKHKSILAIIEAVGTVAASLLTIVMSTHKARNVSGSFLKYPTRHEMFLESF